MPLSEHERQILKQIEGELSVDDPTLAESLGNDGARASLRRRRAGGAVSMLVGFVTLVGGIGLQPPALAYLWFLPIGGYTLMWAGLALLVSDYSDWPVQE